MLRTIGFVKLALFSMAAMTLFQTEATLAQSFLTAPAPQVRMKWQDFVKGPEGAKRQASLEKVVAKMKSFNTSTDKVDYMRSWEYWANIHGYYCPNSMDGKVSDIRSFVQSQSSLAPYISYFDDIKDQSPPNDGVASVVWATCQHSRTDNQGNLTASNPTMMVAASR